MDSPVSRGFLGILRFLRDSCELLGFQGILVDSQDSREFLIILWFLRGFFWIRGFLVDSCEFSDFQGILDYSWVS